ncbi:MAG: hypothetical protein ACLRXQ_09090 [Phascolarctobacterium faecium]
MDELAETLASACGRHAYRLAVPAFPDSLEERQQFETTEAFGTGRYVAETGCCSC